ncbi:ATP synthase subunit C [Tissierella praeacuta]|uniref:ATP synthase F(0) sector subunit c n=1 Tax=Tissierella praeacuta DSM 18095 TaxID=1123404 RepID=A0A1M4VS49_9FIRM|nr:ATP synthase subunit C [Tissierella praeacuta]MBU5256494.1 ATP synthase subunit C [Tissierella praeacuta]SHE71670.1 V/A-type H+-transporting ATPase subunit K [Tissierella praeacuta DSM 18095]SUO98933.1 V-type ATP synthase subunit K [Tissierella praeacuta]
MEFILISTTLMVLMTIGTGIFMIYKNVEGNRKKLKKVLRTNLYVFLPILVATIITLVPGIINAETASTSSVSGFGFIAAALSTGLATVGAGYAVAVVGSSALGAVSEDPSILGKTLIFVGLAEGIAIYGLIVSILILGRL